MLEAFHGHIRSSNLDGALRANLFAVLAKSAPLLWHDRFSTLLLSKSLLVDDNFFLLDRDLRNAHSLGFNDTSLERLVVNLLVEGRVVTALGVDVMSEHVVAVVNATDCWVDIALTVGVEGRLAEVGSEG